MALDADQPHPMARRKTNGVDLEALAQVAREAGAAAGRSAATDMLIQQGITLQSIQTAIEGLKTGQDELARHVGQADRDEYGKPIGTGIAGDLQRLSHQVGQRFRTYDIWRANAKGILIGAGAALTVLGGVIWFLIKDRIGFLK